MVEQSTEERNRNRRIDKPLQTVKKPLFKKAKFKTYSNSPFLCTIIPWIDYVETTPFQMGWYTEDISGEELEERAPLLLYAKENGELVTKENVMVGPITLKDSRGNEINKHYIQGKKRFKWRYDGTDIPVYILGEKDIFCFPHKEETDGRAILNLIYSIKANDKEFEERFGLLNAFNKKNVTMLLYLVGGFLGIVLAVLYLGQVFDFWIVSELFKTTTQPTTEVVKQVIQNESTKIANIP